MKFILNRADNPELFWKLRGLYDRGIKARRSAESLVRRAYRFEAWTEPPDAFMGGVESVIIRDRMDVPPGWSMVGDGYMPRRTSFEMDKFRSILPPVWKWEVNEAIGYEPMGVMVGGRERRMSLPGLVFGDEVILMDFMDYASYYVPLPGIREVLVSEYEKTLSGMNKHKV